MAYDNSAHYARETRRLNEYRDLFAAAARKQDEGSMRFHHSNLRSMAKDHQGFRAYPDAVSASFGRSCLAAFQFADAGISQLDARNCVRDADQREYRAVREVEIAEGMAIFGGGVSSLLASLCRPSKPVGPVGIIFLVGFFALGFWQVSVPLVLAAAGLFGGYAFADWPRWAIRGCRLVGWHATIITGFAVASYFMDPAACYHGWRTSILPINLFVMGMMAA